MALIGEELHFNNEKFFNLNPNTPIIQIGDGRDNGTIRTDKFICPIIYRGSIKIEILSGEKLFAFELSNKPNHYLLYGSTGSEIFTEAINAWKDRITKKPSGYLRFYKPEFY